MTEEEVRQKLSPLVARAWSDEQLRQRLLDNPEAVLRENGVETPAGMRPHFAVDGNAVSFEWVAQTPSNSTELREDALAAVVGGADATPKESISLNFGKIEWTYTQQK